MSGSVTWVAVAALGLSVVNFVWQVGSTFWNRGRIKIGLLRATGFDFDFDTLVKTGESTATFTITVANPGSHPVTVYDAGLEREDDVHIHAKAIQRIVKDGTAADAANLAGQVTGPDLPVEVPAHGVVEWTFSDEATKDRPDSMKYRGFASQYKAGVGEKFFYSANRVPRGMQFDD